MSSLKEFQDAVIVRSVVARVIQAIEFDSPEALKKYLHDHPDADKSKHSVKKKDEKVVEKDDDDTTKAKIKSVRKIVHTRAGIKGITDVFKGLSGDFQDVGGSTGTHSGKVKLKSEKSGDELELSYQMVKGELELSLKFSRGSREVTHKSTKPFDGSESIASQLSDVAHGLMSKIR